jgi:hypothetical protein
MTTTSRQNNLILNEDWTRIYQTFRNADFKSYDFENLRRVIITYLRENYPEDFNDYIESSEYMALIDAVAFLGQSLSFRIDLASRENFIELADRKESVLRLARMLSYNAKRNIAASGLLKFTSVSTTEDLLDSNGRNLAQQVVSWNDPTNTNWLEQFLLILNASMTANTEFGRSQGSASIQGIQTEQYRFNTVSTDVPIYSFNKTVASRGMTFEVVSSAFKGSQSIYEEPPVPANQLGFVYRNDGSGPASSNTGFFILFKQGSLELADFEILVPSTNETISVESANINNNDVWLFTLGSDGSQLGQWAQVSNLIGNNIAYNSVARNIRNIYSVITKTNDRIELQFADGVYGNLPQGSFRTYYRVSNGLNYTISPSELRGITINIPYLNKQGALHTVSVGLALQSTVSNADSTESIDDVRVNAPASYYTQNRMITGEDYNLAPLVSSQNILKIKAVNRTSSGISRNFEIIDASGKYSSINVFADDGYIYKQESERQLSFKFTSRIDIINFIRQNIEKVFTNTDVYNYYLTKFDKVLFTDPNVIWQQLTTDINLTTGYFKNIDGVTLLPVGPSYSTSSLKYFTVGSLIKFVAPTGKAFKNGIIVTADATDPDQRDRLWTKVVKIVGDGTNAGKGALTSGLGPVSFSDTIPTGAIASRIVPRFINDLPVALESEIVNQTFQNLNFGLRYSTVDSSWKIITASNLNLTNDFSLGKAGDTTNSNIDASWIISFVKESDQYVVRIRALDYVFGSVEQNRFYLDVNQKAYNDQSGNVVKDQIKVLGINTGSNLISSLVQTVPFEITDTVKFDDGYESANEIKLACSDTDADGVIDNPEAFELIVGDDNTANLNENYLFFQEVTDDVGNTTYALVDTTVTTIKVAASETTIDINDYTVGDLIYFYDTDENRIKQVTATSTGSKILTLLSTYKAQTGRKGLKFQYLHNASVDRRIDPSASNIIDISIITRSYDTAYRVWLAGGSTEPSAPSSEELRVTFGANLNAIKSISDEIIYHPVKYKVLFGSKADTKLQAQFKVVKNSNKAINDNNLKVRIINAINTFFDINNWDFGDRFYMSELVTYILNSTAPDISNIVIVPRQTDQSFGSLFEIQSKHDEVLISGATVDDVVIVSAITASEVRASAASIVSTT